MEANKEAMGEKSELAELRTSVQELTAIIKSLVDLETKRHDEVKLLMRSGRM